MQNVAEVWDGGFDPDHTGFAEDVLRALDAMSMAYNLDGSAAAREGAIAFERRVRTLLTQQSSVDAASAAGVRVRGAHRAPALPALAPPLTLPALAPPPTRRRRARRRCVCTSSRSRRSRTTSTRRWAPTWA